MNINKLTFLKERQDVKQCNGVSLDLAYQLCYSKVYNSIIRVHTMVILHKRFDRYHGLSKCKNLKIDHVPQ